MSFFRRVFGTGNGRDEASGDQLLRLISPLALPSAQLLTTSTATRSYLGGEPHLGERAQWPTSRGAPLDFIACIDMGSLADALAIPWLPSSGRLLFFYDAQNQPWGFDPHDRGGWAVLHDQGPLQPVPPSAREPYLPQRYVTFRRIQTYPSWERPEVARLHLSDAEQGRLIDVCESVYGGAPPHQISGFPEPLQGDSMELECQLVSHGVYCGDSSGYGSQRARELEGGAKDWRLLLQIASSEQIETMWGDDGMLYFWIREQDARAGRFENVWTILQSC